MLTQAASTTNVCHACIGDPFLAGEVKEQGVRRLCSFCGEIRGAVELEVLAERIHKVLYEHFELTPSQPADGYEYFLASEGKWERRGDPVEFVIAEMAGLSEEISDQVRDLLSGWHGGYRMIKQGGVDPYALDAFYEVREPNDLPLLDAWAAFRSEIRSHARFFSTYANEMLDDIFGDLTAHRTYNDRPVICQINPADEDSYVWRARATQSTKGLEAILKSPVQEIGPPPSRLATAGRMNALGISVFYGAMDPSTCVSEARAPVGSHIVVGRFELLRSVRLLDLDALAEVYVEGSYFDPGYSVSEGRAAFLRQLVIEISRPVMPQDEALEYLSTQAVAEYLANKVTPRLDGMIFGSAQTGGTSRNLVLFNHACGVEPYNLPRGTHSRVSMHRVFGDEEADQRRDIVVFETVPSDSQDKMPPTGASGTLAGPVRVFNDASIRIGYNDEEHCDPPSYREPTLRLDLESVEVFYIKSVSYCSNRHTVIRRRETEQAHDGEEPDFTSLLK